MKPKSRIPLAAAAGNVVPSLATTAQVIRLSPEAQEKFVALLLDPPPPVPALRRALERHHVLIVE